MSQVYAKRLKATIRSGKSSIKADPVERDRKARKLIGESDVGLEWDADGEP